MSEYQENEVLKEIQQISRDLGNSIIVKEEQTLLQKRRKTLYKMLKQKCYLNIATE